MPPPLALAEPLLLLLALPLALAEPLLLFAEEFALLGEAFALAFADTEFFSKK